MLMLLHAQNIANSSLTILYHLRCYHSLDVPNIHVYSQTGWTPLKGASSKGHVDIVRLLIEAKAQINTQKEVLNSYQQTIHTT